MDVKPDAIPTPTEIPARLSFEQEGEIWKLFAEADMPRRKMLTDYRFQLVGVLDNDLELWRHDISTIPWQDTKVSYHQVPASAQSLQLPRFSDPIQHMGQIQIGPHEFTAPNRLLEVVTSDVDDNNQRIVGYNYRGRYWVEGWPREEMEGNPQALRTNWLKNLETL